MYRNFKIWTKYQFFLNNFLKNWLLSIVLKNTYSETPNGLQENVRNGAHF